MIYQKVIIFNDIFIQVFKIWLIQNNNFESLLNYNIYFFIGISNNSSSNYGQMQSNLPIANENLMKKVPKEKQVENMNNVQVIILQYYNMLLLPRQLLLYKYL